MFVETARQAKTPRPSWLWISPWHCSEQSWFTQRPRDDGTTSSHPNFNKPLSVPSTGQHRVTTKRSCARPAQARPRHCHVKRLSGKARIDCLIQTFPSVLDDLCVAVHPIVHITDPFNSSVRQNSDIAQLPQGVNYGYLATRSQLHS